LQSRRDCREPASRYDECHIKRASIVWGKEKKLGPRKPIKGLRRWRTVGKIERGVKKRDPKKRKGTALKPRVPRTGMPQAT